MLRRVKACDMGPVSGKRPVKGSSPRRVILTDDPLRTAAQGRDRSVGPTADDDTGEDRQQLRRGGQRLASNLGDRGRARPARDRVGDELRARPRTLRVSHIPRLGPGTEILTAGRATRRAGMIITVIIPAVTNSGTL